MKNAKEIVSEAWQIMILYRDQLFWFGFIPSFFSLVLSAEYLLYHLRAFPDFSLFGKEYDPSLVEFARHFWNFVTMNSVVSFLTIFFVLGAWLFVPILCRAATTHIISSAKKNEDLGDPLFKSLSSFSFLVPLSALKRGLEPVSFLTEWLFIVRTAGFATAALLFPLIFLFAILGAFSLFFLSLCIPAIVLGKKDIVNSVVFSVQTIFAHLRISLRLLFLFFLIELRILINVVLLLLFPLLLLWLGSFLAHLFSPLVGFFLAGVFGTLLIIVVIYLSGVLFVFSQTIWTIAFLEFETEKNEKI